MLRALLLLILTVTPLFAQTDTTALKSADRSWNELRLTSNVAALDSLLADDWVLIHSDGRVQPKQDYLADLKSSDRINLSIENDDVTIRFYGNVAIVNGISIQSGLNKGQRWSGRFRFTRVWHLEGGQWKMITSHSSRFPE